MNVVLMVVQILIIKSLETVASLFTSMCNIKINQDAIFYVLKIYKYNIYNISSLYSIDLSAK